MAHGSKYTSPEIKSILPKTLEFTPQGIVTKYAITYAGVHPDSELIIRDSNVVYTGGIVAAITGQLQRHGFLADTS